MKPQKYFMLLNILIVLASLLGACKKSSIPPPITITPIYTDTSSAKSYLALGDSYTIGQSVPANERFPQQTRDLLHVSGVEVGNPYYVATTGWTTANLLNALNANPPSNTYDVVTLLIGVNNQFQGESIELYKTEFAALLEKSIQYAGSLPNRVFVLSIPDYSVTPFAAGSNTAYIAEQIDLFNAANKQISQSYGVHYLDITAISREAANNPALIASDGLHPSGLQYARWAALLAPMIKDAL